MHSTGIAPRTHHCPRPWIGSFGSAEEPTRCGRAPAAGRRLSASSLPGPAASSPLLPPPCHHYRACLPHPSLIPAPCPHPPLQPHAVCQLPGARVCRPVGRRRGQRGPGEGKGSQWERLGWAGGLIGWLARGRLRRNSSLHLRHALHCTTLPKQSWVHKWRHPAPHTPIPCPCREW